MQTLRRAPYLARLVLAGFALAIGVAIASPIVQPKVFQLVCAADGVMKLVAQAGDEGAATRHVHTLDCPLCATVAAPLPPQASGLKLTLAVGLALRSPDVPTLASHAAAPLPARGPPTSF